MRKPIIAFLLLQTLLFPLFAQHTPTSKTDQRAKHVPFWVCYNTKRLSKNLTKKCTGDEEKVRSIYFWITRHIKYDVKRFRKFSSKTQTPKKTLFRRRALCSEYAALFVELCKHSGITAITAEGYLKGFGYENDDILYNSDHAWNLVHINDNWYVLDLTLASGKMYMVPFLYERVRAILLLMPLTKSKLVYARKRNDYYYKTPPHLFITDHIPVTKNLQLLSEPFSIDSFEKNRTKPTSDKSLEKDFSFDKEFAEIAAGNALSIITMGDSAYVFNCRNILSQSHFYCNAAGNMLTEALGNKNKPHLDIALIQQGIDYMDSCNKTIPYAREMITEEAYYRTRKNIYRTALSTYYLLHFKKGIHKIYAVGNNKSANKQKIKSLKKQNRYAHKLIRLYTKKNISRIKPSGNLTKEKADSIIAANKKQVRINTDSVHTMADSIVANYTSITTENIQSYLQNELLITSLQEQLYNVSSTSAYLRFNHFDNLDEDLKSNNEYRYLLVDSIEHVIAQRKPLRDTLRSNIKSIHKRMVSIKKYTLNSISLMKKNKQLNDDAPEQFNGVKQDAINALKIVIQKNDALISLSRTEIEWGKSTRKYSRFLEQLANDEKVYEHNRYLFKQKLITGRRKVLLKGCSGILKTNSRNKKEANKIVRKNK
jgi:hypothetical protein